jgi:hypothetical protein
MRIRIRNPAERYLKRLSTSGAGDSVDHSCHSFVRTPVGTVRYVTVPQECLGDKCALLLVELLQLLHQLAVVVLFIAVAILHAASEQRAGRTSNYAGSGSNRAARGERGRFLLLLHTAVAGHYHLIDLRQVKSQVSSLIFYFVFTYIIQ